MTPKDDHISYCNNFILVNLLSCFNKLLPTEMISNITRRALMRGLTTTLCRSYGELTYTNTLQAQSEFNKIPTYRLIDLDGKLLDTKHQYDAKYLAKILKTMIFVDEMDAILLKVKSQGNNKFS